MLGCSYDSGEAPSKSCLDNAEPATNLSSQVGIRAAVDVLFASLAQHVGDRAAAVVYSGADSDGAAGVKHI
jgi:chemotaxis response regulator CheB